MVKFKIAISRPYFCQSANEYSIHSHATPLQFSTTQIPLDVFKVPRGASKMLIPATPSTPKIVKCLRKDRLNLISAQFDSTCLYSPSSKLSRQQRIAGCCFHGSFEMRVALKLLSVVIASPKATPEHFDAFKLFTLRWRGSSRFAHVIRNFEQINAERHFQSDTRNTSPIIS